MSTVTLGKLVPNFNLPATGGRSLQLKDLRGKKVVVYFYPRDSTPGCTAEGCDFGQLHRLFQQANAVILGVSRDSLTAHEKFRKKFSFPFDLLSDGEETLCKAFDVIKEKNMYGKKVLGVERSTFLIDEKGKLRQEWRKVSVKGHAAEVLAAVKNL